MIYYVLSVNISKILFVIILINTLIFVLINYIIIYLFFIPFMTTFARFRGISGFKSRSSESLYANICNGIILNNSWKLSLCVILIILSLFTSLSVIKIMDACLDFISSYAFSFFWKCSLSGATNTTGKSLCNNLNGPCFKLLVLYPSRVCKKFL